MSKTILAIALTLSVSSIAYSQNDFRQGYIVTNTNDTIRGLLNFFDTDKNHTVCEFKTAPDASITTYAPGDIRAYRFERDKSYVSRKITKENGTREEVFLEALVTGRFSLYLLGKDFYVTKDTLKHWLSNKTNISEVDGKSVIVSSNRHIGLLSYLMGDCSQLKERIQRKTNLNEKSLTLLVESYNNCISSPSITYKTEKPWMVVEPGLIGGASHTTLKFKSDLDNHDLLFQDFKVLTDFDPSIAPMVGISLDILTPRASERLSFHLDIMYAKARYNGGSSVTNSSGTYNKTVVLDLENIMFPFAIKYTLPERTVTPYFMLGIHNVYHLKTASTYELHTIRQSFDFKEKKEGIIEIKPEETGVFLAIGAEKNIASRLYGFAELRAGLYNGLIPRAAELRSYGSLLQITVGIKRKH